MTDEKKRRNWIRRALGAVVCASPVVYAIVGACWPADVSVMRFVVAFALVLASCLVAGLNFYLAFLRFRLWMWRHKTQEGYRFVSALPIVGTLLQVAGCTVGFGSLLVGLLGLAAALLDTGGLPWFAVATWKDSSFWDE
jgi:hypothetical protein